MGQSSTSQSTEIPFHEVLQALYPGKKFPPSASGLPAVPMEIFENAKIELSNIVLRYKQAHLRDPCHFFPIHLAYFLADHHWGPGNWIQVDLMQSSNGVFSCDTCKAATSRNTDGSVVRNQLVWQDQIYGSFDPTPLQLRSGEICTVCPLCGAQAFARGN